MNGKTTRHSKLLEAIAVILLTTVVLIATIKYAPAGWVCSRGWFGPPGCYDPYARPPLLPPPIPVEPPPTEPPPVEPVPYAPPPAPPPLGWLFGRYTACIEPDCRSVIVSVGVDGLNVRITPNGPIVLALANGVPVIPLRREGDWLLVAAACPLVPTYTWSITAGGIPLNVCL